MFKQYKEIKEKFKDEFLFFRMGDFYEMFFDDAIQASEILQIALTARSGGAGLKVPMCGVPFHSANNYIYKIIQTGHKVAICEQVEDPKTAKGLVKREVVRVITPGTVLEENALIGKENNHLACLSAKENRLGISYCDVSTCGFYATEVNLLTQWNEVRDELARIAPSEIILDADSLGVAQMQEIESIGYYCTSLKGAYHERMRREVEKISDAEQSLWDHLGAHKAAAVMLSYLADTQKKGMGSLNRLQVYTLEDAMQIDMGTRRNLEIVCSLRSGDQKTSLVSVLDRTKTAMGGRKLKEVIQRPLLSVESIHRRQEYVSQLVDDVFLRKDLAKALKEVYDLERILTRVAYERANARDLRSMQISLIAAKGVKTRLLSAGHHFLEYAEAMEVMEELSELLDESIPHDPPLTVKEGGLIAPGYNAQVDELREISTHATGVLAALEKREKEETGIKTLKIGYNRVFGYYIDVTKMHQNKVPEHYIRKQTLTNSERYITQELKELEDKIINAKDKLFHLEYELFTQIREKVRTHCVEIQRLAEGLAMLDVYLSFAEVAVAGDFVRPELVEEPKIVILEGRHPVVEQLLVSERFIPNDCNLMPDVESLGIITGPNMAGKSTYIRMIAILCIMAQAGSFVPCKAMELGLVDRVFARVGASDDLARGDSTFMVEMKEVSNILKNATSRSLIILDEVGRGTSTIDGLSIAWAISEYIHSQIGARTLFATHYHELVALEEIYQGIVNLSMAVEEKDDDVLFLRKVVRGGTDQSYGIHVARMAGLPPAVINRAGEKLKQLEQGEIKSMHVDGEQIEWQGENPALELLKEINPEGLSPRQALDILYELKERSEG
jgi:DNA mismatch repair protein MutS